MARLVANAPVSKSIDPDAPPATAGGDGFLRDAPTKGRTGCRSRAASASATRAADVDLDALGQAMLARKDELKRQAETAGLPPAELVTM